MNVSQAEAIKDKKAKTCIEHFGVSSYNKTDEYKQRYKQTCLKKYGVDNVSKSESIKQKKIDKVKAISEECTNVFQLPDIKEKIKITCLERFGVENPQQAASIKEKSKATNLQRYGHTCALLSPEVKEKSVATLKKLYGVEHYSQTKEFHSKSVRQYKYNDQLFDSLPELSLYIYATDNNLPIERLPIRLEYWFDNKMHYYFPDFMFNNKLLEIKNDYLYKKMLVKNTVENAKLNCILENNIEIWLPKQYNFAIKYCIEKYGKDFKNKFNIKKNGGDANV